MIGRTLVAWLRDRLWRRHIEDAVRAERETCARIAEEVAAQGRAKVMGHDPEQTGRVVAAVIAQQIRARSRV